MTSIGAPSNKRLRNGNSFVHCVVTSSRVSVQVLSTSTLILGFFEKKMKRGGRTPTPLRVRHWRKGIHDGKPALLCKWCELPIGLSSGTERMAIHKLACERAPKEAKVLAQEQLDTLTAKREAEAAPESPVPKKQSRIADLVPATPPALAQEIDRAVFDFFIGNRLAFWTADDFLWLRLARLMRSTYRPPCGATMRYSMLQTRAEEASERVKEVVSEAAYASVMADGWTNIRRDRIINIAVCAGGNSYLWQTCPVGSATCDAKYICELVLKQIEEIESATAAKVTGVVTDNAPDMRSAWKLLRETRMEKARE